MRIKRREFFKIAGVSASFLTPISTLAQGSEAGERFDNSCGVLVDTLVCIGCRKCEWACNQANQLNGRSLGDFEDKSVLRYRRRPDKNAFTVVNSGAPQRSLGKPDYIKIQCMHCNVPACVSACIVGALQKTTEGPVVYDAWKCMGCRYCMIACPFEMPAYEYDNTLQPRVMKCSFCYRSFAEPDFKPSCVEACPNGALTFGTRRDLIEIARARINSTPSKYVDRIYGETEVGGTSWMYLTSIDASLADLPVFASLPIPNLTETIQHGVFKSFVPPVALFGLLGLVMHALKERQDKDGTNDD